MDRTFATRFRRCLGQWVDGSSLGVFRIALGLLLAFETSIKLVNGKLEELTEPSFHFRYLLVPWDLVPEPHVVLALHWTMIGLSLLVALGFLYRVSVVLLCALWWWYLLSDQSLYINHTYLYCLLLSWFCVIDAHSCFAIDRWLGWRWLRPALPGQVRRWALWLLRGQMGVVYFFGGVAKLNGDWLRGVPLNLWLPSRAATSPLGHLLEWEWLPLAMSYGGLLFDLSIVPLLLIRKTRWFALAWAAAFHSLNAQIFGIGSFPSMSMMLTTLFLEPDWPRRATRWARTRLARIFPARGAKPVASPTGAEPETRVRLISPWLFGALVTYGVLQLALPLRHWLYPGNTAWTEQGHVFSWRMMLRTKRGRVEFHVEDPETGKVRVVNPREHLTPRQVHRMVGQPQLLLQYAHFLADQAELATGQRPRVTARSRVQLNDHPPQPIVDPDVDLASTPRSLLPAPWIMPFRQ